MSSWRWLPVVPWERIGRAMTAKMLEQNLGNYEKTFGTISMPGGPNAGRDRGEHLGFTS